MVWRVHLGNGSDVYTQEMARGVHTGNVYTCINTGNVCMYTHKKCSDVYTQEMFWCVDTGNVLMCTHRKCFDVYTQEMFWCVHTGNVLMCTHRNFFFSLRIFLLEQKLHMAWQQNLANNMGSPRNLQHNTTKEIKIVNTKHTYI